MSEQGSESGNTVKIEEIDENDDEEETPKDTGKPKNDKSKNIPEFAQQPYTCYISACPESRNTQFKHPEFLVCYRSSDDEETNTIAKYFCYPVTIEPTYDEGNNNITLEIRSMPPSPTPAPSPSPSPQPTMSEPLCPPQQHQSPQLRQSQPQMSSFSNPAQASRSFFSSNNYPQYARFQQPPPRMYQYFSNMRQRLFSQAAPASSRLAQCGNVRYPTYPNSSIYACRHSTTSVPYIYQTQDGKIYYPNV